MPFDYAAVIYTHKDVSASDLGRYRLGDDVMTRNSGISGRTPEFVILNTCNRSELYVYSDAVDQTLHAVLRHVGREAGERAQVLKGVEAVKHLFHVASGLESAIIGETEIVHQLKSAYRTYKDAGYCSDNLDSLLRDAINFSGKLRRDTNISKGSISAPYVALSFLPKHLAKGQKVAVVGAGYMAGRALESLTSRYGNGCITLFDRSEDNGMKMAASFYVRFVQLDFGNLDSYDFVVSAIYYDGKSVRLTGPKKIVDLSSPSVFAGENVVGIDEINRCARSSIKMRLDAVEKCGRLIDDYVGKNYCPPSSDSQRR